MPNKRPSTMWTEPEIITLSSGATVTAILNSGATVTVNNSVPTTEAIGIYNSGSATVFVATDTFKITNFSLVCDEAQDIKILSGTDYLAGNASVAMSMAAEGQLTQSGSPDSPVFVASGVAKGFVINSSVTGKVAGSVTWIDE